MKEQGKRKDIIGNTVSPLLVVHATVLCLQGIQSGHNVPIYIFNTGDIIARINN